MLFLNKNLLLNGYYLFFLAVLILCIVFGITKYGFRSIGEGRYVYWLFFAFVPIAFYYYGGLKDINSFDKLFKTTYYLIVINVLFLFVVELINGGRIFIAAQNDELVGLEDSVRGKRFLGSEDTFHLGVFVLFAFISEYLAPKKKIINIAIIIVITAVIFFTKNRAALGSIAFGLLCFLLVEVKFKKLIQALIVGGAIVTISIILIPNILNEISKPFSSAINITEDETGSWRLLVQAVAIEQGMQSPIIGQGFGGYFDYYIPELNQTYNFPPHSIYVFLFQKTGIVGLLAYIMALIALLVDVSQLKIYTKNNLIAEKYRLLLKAVLIAQIPYGFAFGFSVYLGLYVGLLAVLRKISNTQFLSEKNKAIPA